MSLKLHNTYTKKLEEFIPLKKDSVSLYTCGPTVYDYPHIGNYRAYIFGDTLKRYLSYQGYQVNHIMNITDIDDKTIRDSQKNGQSLREFTEFYTNEFYKDRDMLNIIPADSYPMATEYIDEMVKIIEKLIEKGHAYVSTDGSVYFNISTFPGYGKLAHIDLSELRDNAKGRMKSDEYDKDSVQDFALWKAYDESDGNVFWETSLGKGRPGWHIECTAMSIKNLGEQTSGEDYRTIDIHTGGVDNIFPHHENEIAQSESYTGKQFVKYWMHNEWLLVNGKKMSKSLGNFYTLRDLITKGISPLGYRLWLMTSHYRTLTNLNIETLQGADTALSRLYEAFRALPKDDNGTVDMDYKLRFIEYMNDDLNTPQALALLWELVKDPSIPGMDKRVTMLDFDRVFGFGLADLKEEIVPEEVMKLVEEREFARLNKDWDLSDVLRAKINTLGYEVKDTGEGSKISKI
ncbi:cysteine--tRNA ligase [Candidatus Nomurabacteria bacterium]|nr:cysteine--tRNA ligase [Candidatus Nomurabacteria bacterium]